jgi:hypothetical protein
LDHACSKLVGSAQGAGSADEETYPARNVDPLIAIRTNALASLVVYPRGKNAEEGTAATNKPFAKSSFSRAARQTYRG